MATPFLPGIIVWPARDDSGSAKRARDGGLVELSEEADARGWSSSVLERSLAPRRRRGPASGSGIPTHGCGWVAAAAAAADEVGCGYEEPATPEAVAAGAGDEETDLVEPSCFAFLDNLDMSVFLCDIDPAAFVTDLESGLVILDPLIDYSGADDTSDELGCGYEEPVTPEAVAAGAGAEETDLVEPSCFAFLDKLDMSVFLSDIDPAAFVTDLESGLIILDPLTDYSGADDTADEHGCRYEETPTPDVVASDPSDAKETVGSDPYFSFYFGMVL